MKNKNGSVSTSVKVSISVICVCHPRTDLGNLISRNKKLIRLLESFAILVAVISMPLGVFWGPSVMKADADLDISPNVVLAQQNIDPINLTAEDKAKEQDIKKAEMLELQGKAIDAYFATRNMPMEGTGMKLAMEAEKNSLDWRLLPAISVIETTGGKFACPGAYKRTGDKGYTYNAFGWGSCKISFKSKDHAIEVIARNLSGNNPKTDHLYHDKMSTKQKLERYNPPSVKPHYAKDVMAIMNTIGKEDVGITLKATTSSNT